jgi:hypothetical protein
MNLNELDKKLKDLNISEDNYYLQGLYGSTSDDEKLALIIKKGKYSIEFEVYFKERGEKHSIRLFETETEACKYFLKKMKGINDLEVEIKSKK